MILYHQHYKYVCKKCVWVWVCVLEQERALARLGLDLVSSKGSLIYIREKERRRKIRENR